MDAAQLFFMRSDQSVALIMGNERYGIDPETVNECHAIVWIPMQGLKGSLNVALAFGIAAYYLRFAYLASEKK
jgi:tRNA G18 (ribose-2'-O)-methylase SpoU